MSNAPKAIVTKGGQEVTDSQPGEYTKAIIAIFGSAATIVLSGLMAGPITPALIVNAIIAAVTVVPVAWLSQKWWLKAIAAGVLAGLQALVLIVASATGWSTVTGANWAAVILAFVVAAGVGIIPNNQAKALAALPVLRSNADLK
jgi:hypothetical protein